jgi:hypothetical protein
VSCLLVHFGSHRRDITFTWKRITTEDIISSSLSRWTRSAPVPCSLEIRRTERSCMCISHTIQPLIRTIPKFVACWGRLRIDLFLAIAFGSNLLIKAYVEFTNHSAEMYDATRTPPIQNWLLKIGFFPKCLSIPELEFPLLNTLPSCYMNALTLDVHRKMRLWCFMSDLKRSFRHPTAFCSSFSYISFLFRLELRMSSICDEWHKN